MNMSAKKNTRLCGLVSVSGAPIQAGAKLFAADGSSREAGWITSAIHSTRLEKEIALGFVKRGFNDAGSQLISRAPNTGEVPVAVVALPFT
jgi:glycine cleavage system aminomethyltransferase T